MSTDQQDLKGADSGIGSTQLQGQVTEEAIENQPQSQTQAQDHQQAQEQQPMLPPPASSSAIGNDSANQRQQPQQYTLPPFSNLSQYSDNAYPPSGGNAQLPSITNLTKPTPNAELKNAESINLPPASAIISEASTNGASGATNVIVNSPPEQQKHVSESKIESDHEPVNPDKGQEGFSDQTHAQAQAIVQGQKAANYKPLNVKDALNYLDQVKFQFRDQSDVYNNFLDIMKDFKSQNIDTPGVIERVSTLFKGHSELIDGFNTFLPQGFAIECSTSDPNTIIVTTPQGTTIRKDNMSLDVNGQTQQKQQQQQQQLQQPQVPMLGQPLAASASVQDAYVYHQQMQAQYAQGGELPPGYDQQMYQQQLQQHQALQQQQAQQHQAQLQQGVDSKQSTPAEFDQAINYVNKIKQRYANQPDIYKLFLENLQMYQKGIKPINEVYHEISILFRDAPDLLEDFKLFMPDNTIVREPQPQEYVSPAPIYQAPSGVQLPPVGNFQSVSYGNGHEELLQSQYQQQQQQQAQQQAMLDAQYQMENQQLLKERKKKEESISDRYPVSALRTTGRQVPSLLPGVPNPVFPRSVDSDLTNELNFFDKLKKAIGNKQTYNEFLKIIRLYNSDVIDKRTLMEKVLGFIGGFPEMYQWFKDFIGWEDTPLRIENIAIKKQPLDLLMCKPYGPSYRKLPKSQTHMACSGRDAICWEVFNDEWVGHPVWASEESGFIAHRKNQYEEILFRIEDERHEYDYYMEANTRVIQTLETIANRLANMSDEEKANFKLPPGLGHTSNTIYKRVIRKIYDRDRGWEVIDALHEHPAITVPIVLKRLQQKDEEWKRAQREWNNVWREAEQKLMMKALDHLGLQFKNIDKKLLTNKHLVQELSTIKQEQQTKKLHPLMTRPKSQLVCKYEDFSIFIDIFKLVQISLKHQGYSRNEKNKIDSFFRSFIIDFFFLDGKYIDAELAKRGIVEDDEQDEKEQTPEPTIKEDELLPTLSQAKKRSREHDLLKDVLRKNKRKKVAEDSEINDVENKPEQSSNVEVLPSHTGNNDETDKVEPNWITNDNFKAAIGEARNEYNMFCNTQIYVFYRYLDTLYKRLLEVKNISAEANKLIKARKVTKYAKDLGLIDNHLESLGINIKGDDSYLEALTLCEKLIDKKLEANDFEEALREGFNNKAFKMFTIDRVVSNIVKFIHNLMSDNKCGEILLLMEKDRQQIKTSAKDQILYRIQVRNFMNAEENMFKMTYDREAKTTNITFLALDDLTIKDVSQDKDAKWNYYLTSYSMSHPTEGIDASKIKLPFLKSILDEDEDEDELDGISESKLSVKIDVDTYRMKFDPTTYDLFIRDSLFTKKANGKSTKESRVSKLVNVIDGDMGVGGDLGNEDQLKKATERINILFEKGPNDYLNFEKQDESQKKEDSEQMKEEAPSTESKA